MSVATGWPVSVATGGLAVSEEISVVLEFGVMQLVVAGGLVLTGQRGCLLVPHEVLKFGRYRLSGSASAFWTHPIGHASMVPPTTALSR